LIEILDHSSSQDAKRHAAYALGVIGPQARQAAPSLVRAITNSDSFELWGSCLTALGHIGAEPRLAVPVLVKIYEDPTPCPVPVRAGAVKALGELHGEPELAVPVLIKALRDPDVPNVQQNAIRALSRFGLDAKPAVRLVPIPAGSRSTRPVA
jgi:HEAT repeat protein